VLKFRRLLRIILPVLAVAVAIPSPAHAQFSAGYKFLEAVRKKKGDEVNEALGAPGTNIVNTKDITSGETALHIVTNRRDLTWMSFLLAKEANPNLRDAHGATPLQMAANIGFAEGVDLLISKGARVDEPNNTGETPLISAVHRRDIAVMRALLKAGANPDRSDNSGRTARDYALLEGRSGPLIGEIETNAKPRAARAASTYGPSF
jgi:ankyrin repeat protein